MNITRNSALNGDILVGLWSSFHDKTLKSDAWTYIRKRGHTDEKFEITI